MKHWNKLWILVGTTLVTNGITLLGAHAAGAKEIDLGSSSIEGTIRYPSFQVIENTETLKQAAQEVMGREFNRLEDEILAEAEVGHESR